MRVDLFLHIPKEVQGQIDLIIDLLHDVRTTQVRQGALMSAALDALKVEIGEIAADVDKAVALLEGLATGATAEEIAEVTATLNAAQQKLDGVVNPPPPQP